MGLMGLEWSQITYHFRIASIITSPALYLITFAFYINTVKEYYTLQGDTFLDPRTSRLISVALIVLLIVSHAYSALLFKFTFDKKDQPLMYAYFLPFIQFHRLVKLLWRTCSCKGYEDLPQEKITLYNILSATLETGPGLFVQFIALKQVYFIRNPPIPPDNIETPYTRPAKKDEALLILSILVSFLSLTYHGAMVVMSITRTAQSTIGQAGTAVLAGLFIASSLAQRCITMFFTQKLFDFFALLIYILPVLIAEWVVYLFVFSFDKAAPSDGKVKKCFKALIYGYISFIIGPLYPLVSLAKDRQQLGQTKHQIRFACIALLHCSSDMLAEAFFYYLLRISKNWQESPEWINHPRMIKHGVINMWVNELPRYLFAPQICGLLLYIFSAIGIILMDIRISCETQQPDASAGSTSRDMERNGEEELKQGADATHVIQPIVPRTRTMFVVFFILFHLLLWKPYMRRQK